MISLHYRCRKLYRSEGCWIAAISVLRNTEVQGSKFVGDVFEAYDAEGGLFPR